jgi:hypothetical protein
MGLGLLSSMLKLHFLLTKLAIPLFMKSALTTSGPNILVEGITDGIIEGLTNGSTS